MRVDSLAVAGLAGISYLETSDVIKESSDQPILGARLGRARDLVWVNAMIGVTSVIEDAPSADAPRGGSSEQRSHSYR